MKKIYGVGVNDYPGFVTKNIVNGGNKKQIWKCPIYSMWTGMLMRCYSEKHKEKHPYYCYATVEKEWHSFSNFRNWVIERDYVGLFLDKDLKHIGNTVYGPDNCLIVSRCLNNFFTLRNREKEVDFPGVVYYHNIHSWVAKVNDEGKRIYIGSYTNPEEAHFAWMREKLSIAKLRREKETNNDCITGWNSVISHLEMLINKKQIFSLEV